MASFQKFYDAELGFFSGFILNANPNCTKCCIQKEQSKGKENIFHFIQ